MFDYGRAQICFILGQFVTILFFGLFTTYGEGTDPQTPRNYKPSLTDTLKIVNGTATYDQLRADNQVAAENIIRNSMADIYPMFQDVHIMIFIGFGFLMVFLKSHNWSSIGYNYIIACWAVQITILWNHFWDQVAKYYDNQNHVFQKLDLNILVLLNGDYGAAAVLITFGAILGKCSLFQLFGIASIECMLFALNRAILQYIFKAEDIGGSMYIHIFGGFFGIAAQFFYQVKAACRDEKKLDKGNYLSDIISMTGTLFLFVYWPSFNAAETIGSAQQRAVINTYLSISTSVIAAIIWSKICFEGKLDMEIILNASLAGGVAMGCNANIIVMPFGAMLTGIGAGTVASLGFAYGKPFLRRRQWIHDTCGVLYLHCLPGVIGGIISAIVASRTRDTISSEQYGQIFEINNDDYRNASEQAGFQLAAIGICIGFGIFGGLFAGALTSLQFFQPPPEECLFEDTWHWAECVIDHQTLRNLFEVGKKLLEEDSNSSKILKRKRIDHSLVMMDPQTIADDQDLDILNLHKDKKTQ